MQPFSIVSNRGFQSLMKTGRPESSASTVLHDVKHVFTKVRSRIMKMPQVRIHVSYIIKGNKITCGSGPLLVHGSYESKLKSALNFPIYIYNLFIKWR